MKKKTKADFVANSIFESWNDICFGNIVRVSTSLAIFKSFRSQSTFRVNLLAIAGHSVHIVFIRSKYNIKMGIKRINKCLDNLFGIQFLDRVALKNRARFLCAYSLISLTKNNGNKLYGDDNFLFGNCSKAISFKGFVCLLDFSPFSHSVCFVLLLMACVFVLIHILFQKKQLHPIGVFGWS